MAPLPPVRQSDSEISSDTPLCSESESESESEDEADNETLQNEKGRTLSRARSFTLPSPMSSRRNTSDSGLVIHAAEENDNLEAAPTTQELGTAIEAQAGTEYSSNESGNTAASNKGRLISLLRCGSGRSESFDTAMLNPPLSENRWLKGVTDERTKDKLSVGTASLHTESESCIVGGVHRLGTAPSPPLFARGMPGSPLRSTTGNSEIESSVRCKQAREEPLAKLSRSPTLIGSATREVLPSLRSSNNAVPLPTVPPLNRSATLSAVINSKNAEPFRSIAPLSTSPPSQLSPRSPRSPRPHLHGPSADCHIRLLTARCRLPYGGFTSVELLEDATLRDLMHTVWKVGN